MGLVRLFVFSIFLVCQLICFQCRAQSEYDYSYDGNRIQRSHTSLMVAPPNGDEVQETPKIGEDWEHFSLSLFPNPTREGVNIEVEGEEIPEEVVVLDNLGREILRQKFTSHFETINISAFATGTYYFRLFYKGEMKQYTVIKI